MNIDEILKDEGWTVECESPFEIRHIDGSFVSGLGAVHLVESLREERTTYRFITYGAKNLDGTSNYNYWNEVIDISPMEFIKKVENDENKGGNYYGLYHVVSACEITQKEYKEYKDNF